MMIPEYQFTGGESVYCINQMQLKRAIELARDDTASGLRIREVLRKIETDLTRNERAALAFVLVERLLNSDATAAAAEHE